MEKTAIDDVDLQLSPLAVHGVRRPVSQDLGTEHVAMNYFEIAPGESFWSPRSTAGRVAPRPPTPRR